jgi:hypothetical protein
LPVRHELSPRYQQVSKIRATEHPSHLTLDPRVFLKQDGGSNNGFDEEFFKTVSSTRIVISRSNVTGSMGGYHDNRVPNIRIER